jgi:hypothetical protein
MPLSRRGQVHSLPSGEAIIPSRRDAQSCWLTACRPKTQARPLKTAERSHSGVQTPSEFQTEIRLGIREAASLSNGSRSVQNAEGPLQSPLCPSMPCIPACNNTATRFGLRPLTPRRARPLARRSIPVSCQLRTSQVLRAPRVAAAHTLAFGLKDGILLLPPSASRIISTRHAQFVALRSVHTREWQMPRPRPCQCPWCPRGWG